jgi:hypothetical protein
MESINAAGFASPPRNSCVHSAPLCSGGALARPASPRTFASFHGSPWRWSPSSNGEREYGTLLLNEKC